MRTSRAGWISGGGAVFLPGRLVALVRQGCTMPLKYSLGIMVVATAVLRLLCACYLGLGNDEAYHSLYADHPSLGYYDHPPMMAWIAMAGLTLDGDGASTWPLRVGFIALFAGSTLLLARLTARYYGERAGFIAALAMNLTGYYGLAASMFALPDGPLLFFWLLSMDRLSIALDGPDSSRAGAARRCAMRCDRPVLGGLLPWVWVGLAWGGAMLSKYHGIFLPMGTGLFMVLHRPARRWLGRPGPYLAGAIALGLFSPVIVWNAMHGWASFLFQGGRAVGGATFRPDHMLLALAAQAMYLFPWIWVPLVLVLFSGCYQWRRLGEKDRLWLSLAVAPVAVFTVVACFRPVLPHWGLIGLVSLFPLLGRKWSTRFEIRPRATRRLFVCCGLFSVIFLAFTIVEYRYGILQRGRDGRGGLIDASRDPTLDLYGWDQVAREIRARGLVEDPGTFLFTRFWYQSAQLAHAMDDAHPGALLQRRRPTRICVLEQAGRLGGP